MKRKAGLLGALVGLAVGIPVALFTQGDSGGDTLSLSYEEGTCTSASVCWTCKSAVNYDTVSISIQTNQARVDAIKLAPGCSGTIGRLAVVTRSADGVKGAEGAHDLTINGGSITCIDKVPIVHQDAVQIMGGSNITFRNMRLDCGRAGEPLIDSNFFVNQAGQSTSPPSAIICSNCWLGPYTAHTANIETSVRSGVRSSTVCPGKFPKLTFTVGADALNPVNRDNTFPVIC